MTSYFTGEKRNRNIAIAIGCLIIIGLIFLKSSGTSATVSYEYTKAEVKDIKKTVEGSGKVVSQSELDIQQLQSGGKITSVLVKPGDYVKKGQIIATLDNRQALIQLQQAKASYQKSVNGNTPESLDIAKQSLANAMASYESTKKQQDLAVDNAKRNLLNTSTVPVPVYDSLIQPNSPTVTGSYTCDREEVYDVTITSTSYASVSSNSGAGQVLISSVPQPLGNCGLYISFDSNKSFANGEWKIYLPNKISSSYGTNLNSYNNALASRDSALQSASTTIVNAQLSLNQSLAGTRPEDLMSAKASLDSANLAYDNTIIRAPFDGQIGSVSAAVGQQTNSQQGVATIITKNKIAQISLNEIDIVNVKLGQPVDLTFDAIPNEVFKGEVSEINTVGNQTSNVVTFAVKISIPDADERIKSGMSVTANIITKQKQNILTVPSATIKSEGSGANIRYFVLKKGATNSKVYVEIGMSNDVDTEIVNGLNQGDQVVSKIINGANVTKTSTTINLFGGGAGQNRNFNSGGARPNSGR